MVAVILNSEVDVSTQVAHGTLSILVPVIFKPADPVQVTQGSIVVSVNVVLWLEDNSVTVWEEICIPALLDPDPSTAVVLSVNVDALLRSAVPVIFDADVNGGTSLVVVFTISVAVWFVTEVSFDMVVIGSSVAVVFIPVMVLFQVDVAVTFDAVVNGGTSLAVVFTICVAV